MAGASSPSGTSSGSVTYGSLHGENLQASEVRKRKRMVSNRESARRSRMRKQKHMDDLTAQVAHLRAENNHILTNINLVSHLFLNTESENSVLRAQTCELSHRLQALNDIITCMTAPPNSSHHGIFDDHDILFINGVDDHLFNPASSLAHLHHPSMASSHAFMY